jgi:prolyl-tRNA synthetase
VKSHSDDSGVVMPFEIAPVQVALVPVMVGKNDEKIQSYISAVSKMLSPFFR